MAIGRPKRPDRREEVLSECAPLKMTLLQRGLLEAAPGRAIYEKITDIFDSAGASWRVTRRAKISGRDGTEDGAPNLFHILPRCDPHP